MEQILILSQFYQSFPPIHDSVVTLAFAFVTLTPNCFALAMISTLFLDETACAILNLVRYCRLDVEGEEELMRGLLCDISLVVHEQEVNVGRLVDQESFVPGWHHVASLLVRTEPDLYIVQVVSFR